MFDTFEGKGKIYTQVITKSPIKIIMQTTMHQIHGMMHVRVGDRVKDELDTADHFLAVTNAELFDVSGTNLMFKTNFLAVNLNQIIWVIPEKELVNEELVE
ncbi:MAG: hypothetical protein D9V45_11410 [Chloroflexi bacterium]|nr:hypothetical protein [Anaerolinea sp.]TDA65202.1 MAG: hypothetical protein D9V45_11410 [Chloroflexota bacterium]